jgi:hypothetical protein
MPQSAERTSQGDLREAMRLAIQSLTVQRGSATICGLRLKPDNVFGTVEMINIGWAAATLASLAEGTQSANFGAG